MPLYEYQCEACEHRFEQIQKFSDPPISVCPTCGGTVRKLLSSPAIQFKGTGWYVTDYAKKGTSGTEASEAGKSEGGSADSTEKKKKSDSAGSAESKATATKSSDASKTSSPAKSGQAN